MNRRQTKKQLTRVLTSHTAPGSIGQLISNAMQLAVEVNQKTKYCIYVRYYGHINEIDFQIAASKTQYNTELAKWSLPTHPYEFASESYIRNRLKSVINAFQQILDTGEVPYDQLESYEHQETRCAL